MERKDWEKYAFYGVDNLAEVAVTCSIDKGFIPPIITPERFMLLTIGEIIEMHEDMRDGLNLREMRIVDGKPVGPPSEIADLIIRATLMGRSISHGETGDKDFGLGFRLMEGSSLLTHLSLAEVIAMKVYHNHQRPPKHGRKF